MIDVSIIWPATLSVLLALLGWMLTCLFNSHFRTFPESHMISLLLGAMLASGSDLKWSLFFKEK